MFHSIGPDPRVGGVRVVVWDELLSSVPPLGPGRSGTTLPFRLSTHGRSRGKGRDINRVTTGPLGRDPD